MLTSPGFFFKEANLCSLCSTMRMPVLYACLSLHSAIGYLFPSIDRRYQLPFQRSPLEDG